MLPQLMQKVTVENFETIWKTFYENRPYLLVFIWTEYLLVFFFLKNGMFFRCFLFVVEKIFGKDTKKTLNDFYIQKTGLIKNFVHSLITKITGVFLGKKKQEKFFEFWYAHKGKVKKGALFLGFLECTIITYVILFVMPPTPPELVIKFFTQW